LKLTASFKTLDQMLSYGKVMRMTESSLCIDKCLLESAAHCLDETSIRSLAALELDQPSRTRLDLLAQKANEGQLTIEEAKEYDRFIDLVDIFATLRLKAERHLGLRLSE
jgi:hypothetical protein